MSKLISFGAAIIAIIFLAPLFFNAAQKEVGRIDGTPENCLQYYIEAYLRGCEKTYQSPFVRVDNNIWKMFTGHMNEIPRPLWKEEEGKVNRAINTQLDNLERSKRDHSFIFNNPLRINERGGHMLLAILYPNMKYKIIDKKGDDLLFVELTYDVPRAPVTIDGKYIRSAIVKVLFAKYKSVDVMKKPAQSIITYKVDHYEPTDYRLVLEPGPRYYEEKARCEAQWELAPMISRSKTPTRIIGKFKCINTTVCVGTHPRADGIAILTDVDASYIHVYKDYAGKVTNRVKAVFWFGNIRRITKVDGYPYRTQFELKNIVQLRPGDHAYGIYFENKFTRDDFYNKIVQAKADWDQKYHHR